MFGINGFERFRLLLFAAASLLLSAGCVTTNLPPISVQGAAYEPLEDELGLWETSREQESLMLDQVEIYQDPALDRYLEQLIARLESPGMAANREVRFRVTVLDDPTLHAFAYPHGSIYVHSGLLAEADYEDQIAAILAHEMTHVENRHMLRHDRARWNRMVPIAVVSFGVALALAIDELDAEEDCDYEEAALIDELSEDVLDFGFALASRVSARGFGRRLEREADKGMLDKLRANGYHLGVVTEFYDRLDNLADIEGQEVLAHALGSDIAQRLRKLAESGESTSSTSATVEPLLTPPELARLLRGLSADGDDGDESN